jgi:hypothetical protein
MPAYLSRTAVEQQLTLGGTTALLSRLTWSVMGWFRAPSAATYREIYTESAAFNIQMYVRINNTGLADFWFRTPTAFIAALISAGRVDDDVWHRFLFVRRATNDFQAWVDEASIGTDATTCGTDATAPSIAVGNWQQATGNGDEPFSGHLARMVALREAITPGEAKQILMTGQTGRGKLWHFELDGRLPEPTVPGSGAIGSAYVAASTVAPGASQIGLPASFVPLTDRAPPGMLDWLITDTPANPGPSVDQQRAAAPVYASRRY